MNIEKTVLPELLRLWLTLIIIWEQVGFLFPRTGIELIGEDRSNKSLEPTVQRLSVNIKGYLRRLNFAVRLHSS